MINLKIRKLDNEAKLPTKAHITDACFDIYANCSAQTICIEPDSFETIHTGFCTEIPDGYFAAVFCRSGMGIKRHLRLCNSVGIIDSSYRGEWLVALHNDGLEPQIIKHGDRIAQFALLPVLTTCIEEVDELDETERGVGGFGSSGR